MKSETSRDTDLKSPEVKSLFKILIVEDNPGDILIVRELLSASDIQFTLSSASTLKESLLLCLEETFDIILLDLGLPDSSGLETLKKILVFKEIPPVIVMTGLDDEDVAFASLREGAQDYLVKNRLSSENILHSIKYGIERKKLQDLQARTTHQYSILSGTTTSLNESEEKSTVYSIFSDAIGLLIDGANVFTVEFDSKNGVHLTNLRWLEKWFDIIKNLTGYNMTHPDFQNPENDSKLTDFLKYEKINILPDRLYDLFSGKIEKEICRVLEKEIGIGYLYSIGFLRNKFCFGGAFIITRDIIRDDEKKIIETIASQASLTILKRNIEKELRISEAKYRRLSEALEKSNEQIKGEIIARKKNEEDLRIAEEKYRTVADFTYDWETWITPAGNFIYVSPSCKLMTGYSVEEFINDPQLFIRIAHPDDREKVEAHYIEKLKGGVSDCSLEFRIITLEGKELWIGHSCRQVINKNGKWIGQRGSNRDITEEKKAQKVLIESENQLRALTHRMDAIAEEERTRIAREIHDELGHLLTVMKYDLEDLNNKPDLTHELVFKELNDIIGMVDSLIDSVRSISSELRPGVLDHLGLLPAIEWLISQFQMRTKIVCEYKQGKMDISFNKSETTIIFRITQEILTNVARHSGAKKVTVTLNYEDGIFVLSVKDNGTGFKMKESYYTDSLGMMGMRERALSIGGEIRIESKKDRGTTISLLLRKK
jgi:PAS domain S-box-containing protein